MANLTANSKIQLLYPIFYEKGTPFVFLLLTNGIPLTNLV